MFTANNWYVGLPVKLTGPEVAVMGVCVSLEMSSSTQPLPRARERCEPGPESYLGRCEMAAHGGGT